jgi:hypothetical protein
MMRQNFIDEKLQYDNRDYKQKKQKAFSQAGRLRRLGLDGWRA